MSWKSASFSFANLGTAAGSVTNLATLSFTAPQNGFVWLQSSGYCNTQQGATTTEIWVGWATSPSSAPDFFNGQAAVFRIIGGVPTGISASPYSISAVFSVVTGPHTFYLNGENLTGTTIADNCLGTNILIFTTAQLP